MTAVARRAPEVPCWWMQELILAKRLRHDWVEPSVYRRDKANYLMPFKLVDKRDRAKKHSASTLHFFLSFQTRKGSFNHGQRRKGVRWHNRCYRFDHFLPFRSVLLCALSSLQLGWSLLSSLIDTVHWSIQGDLLTNLVCSGSLSWLFSFATGIRCDPTRIESERITCSYREQSTIHLQL